MTTKAHRIEKEEALYAKFVRESKYCYVIPFSPVVHPELRETVTDDNGRDLLRRIGSTSKLNIYEKSKALFSIGLIKLKMYWDDHAIIGVNAKNIFSKIQHKYIARALASTPEGRQLLLNTIEDDNGGATVIKTTDDTRVGWSALHAAVAKHELVALDLMRTPAGCRVLTIKSTKAENGWTAFDQATCMYSLGLATSTFIRVATILRDARANDPAFSEE